MPINRIDHHRSSNAHPIGFATIIKSSLYRLKIICALEYQTRDASDHVQTIDGDKLTVVSGICSNLL